MNEELLQLLVGALMVLFLLPIHESAHALVADCLGDPTARGMGRLTLNPLRHIDPLGAIMLIAVHFGWGKPVPVDTRYFRKPKRDMALVALAGPASNLVMALLLMMLVKVLAVTVVVLGLNPPWMGAVLYVIDSLSMTSIYLALFNLLPVPPLDGSRLMEYVIPGGYYRFFAPIQRFIYPIMMILLFTGVLTRPLSICSIYLYQFMDVLTSFIPMLAGLFL